MEWVRDYLVLPFHRRHRPEWITSLHIIIVLVVVGVWHGAGWNWVLFGLIHGVALCTISPVEVCLPKIQYCPTQSIEYSFWPLFYVYPLFCQWTSPRLW